MLDFLREKRGMTKLPDRATESLCCLATSGRQSWQVGTPHTLQYLARVYCQERGIAHKFMYWTLSELGVPAPFGEPRSQEQLLMFLSRLFQVGIHPLAISSLCGCLEAV